MKFLFPNLDFTVLDGSAFEDLGESLGAVPDDYCGNARDDGSPDIGAIEYDAQAGACDPLVVTAMPVPSVFGLGVFALIAGALVLAGLAPRDAGPMP